MLAVERILDEWPLVGLGLRVPSLSEYTTIIVRLDQCLTFKGPMLRNVCTTYPYRARDPGTVSEEHVGDCTTLRQRHRYITPIGHLPQEISAGSHVPVSNQHRSQFRASRCAQIRSGWVLHKSPHKRWTRCIREGYAVLSFTGKQELAQCSKPTERRFLEWMLSIIEFITIWLYLILKSPFAREKYTAVIDRCST